MRANRLAAATALALLGVAIPAAAEPTAWRDIDYLPGVTYADGRDLLDIHAEEGARGAPVIVWFHGGALMEGDKSWAEPVAERLVALGFVLVAPNYRLSPAVRHPAHIQDAAAATAWVYEHIADYGGDPQRLYVGGHSAGGYLAVLLALDGQWLEGAGMSPANLRGAVPVSPFLYVEETARERPKIVWGEDPADWLAASVTPHIVPGKGRMLLIYADGDDDWRREQNERFAAAMRDAGNPDYRAVQVDNRDHMTLISAINDEDDRIAGLIAGFVRAKK